MDARISVVTLGVADVPRARQFYERLGWKAHPSSQASVAFFQANGMVFALFGREALAHDAQTPMGSGFGGITLAYNVGSKPEVTAMLDAAQRAGGRIVKAAQDVFWGGHSGYFADLDGHLWEVAWNPIWGLNADGTISLPRP
jgi:catechol 2,3-dioxygenase-like lactoylglutathione lyase family enzyme